MPNGKGGIVDDLLVYRIDAETYLLVINAANIDKDWNHIVEEGKKFGLEPVMASSSTTLRTRSANWRSRVPMR